MQFSSLRAVYDAAHHNLDKTSYLGIPPHGAQAKLQTLVTAWTASGGYEDGKAVIMKARGTIGGLNTTREDGRLRDSFLADIARLKSDLRDEFHKSVRKPPHA